LGFLLIFSAQLYVRDRCFVERQPHNETFFSQNGELVLNFVYFLPFLLHCALGYSYITVYCGIHERIASVFHSR